jgi:hypothetical protein
VKKLWIGLLSVVTSAAMAGSGSGTVTGFIPGNASGTSVFVFQTSSNPSSSATSCNTTLRFAMASTNPQYSSTVAAVMSAYASGAPVIAVGTGSCTLLSNAEDLNYVCVGTIPC